MLVRRWIAKIVIPAAAFTALGQARAEGLADLTKPPPDYKNAAPTNPNGDPNSVTISAYDSSLSDTEMVEIAVAKELTGWGKRGSVGIYYPMGIKDESFPGGERHFLFGAEAELYIKKGAMLRGLTTVGMPVDDFGSANFGKNVAQVNIRYAFQQLARTPALKDALLAIARDKPELAAAAAKADLNDRALVAELATHVAQDPRLAATWGTLMKELSLPIAFVVNGFGTDGNDRGALHYGVHKRRANDTRTPTGDEVVAQKIAGLMRDWWKAALPEAKAAGAQLRFFTANHCAGTYEDGDWMLHLERLLKKEDPALAREVMRRTYSYDLGAGANKPKDVHHLVELGPRDMFGHINTTNEAMAEAKMVDAGHMVNASLAEVSPTGLKALPLKAFHEAFGLPLYSMAGPTPTDARAFAGGRMQQLRAIARRHRAASSEQARLLADLDERSPDADKVWATYRMAVANLKGNQAIERAQARRALALAHVQKLKAQGASPEAVAAAWSQVADDKRDARAARAAMKAQIGGIGILRTLTFSDVLQYKGYVHGGQDTANAKMQEQQFADDPAKKAEYDKLGEAFGQRYKGQLANFYARAKGAVEGVRKTNANANPTPNAAPAAKR